MAIGTFRNKKTGTLYIVERVAVNATNAQNGQPMFLYRPINSIEEYYVRDQKEFMEKFEVVLDANQLRERLEVAERQLRDSVK